MIDLLPDGMLERMQADIKKQIEEIDKCLERHYAIMDEMDKNLKKHGYVLDDYRRPD